MSGADALGVRPGACSLRTPVLEFWVIIPNPMRGQMSINEISVYTKRYSDRLCPASEGCERAGAGGVL